MYYIRLDELLVARVMHGNINKSKKQRGYTNPSHSLTILKRQYIFYDKYKAKKRQQAERGSPRESRRDITQPQPTALGRGILQANLNNCLPANNMQMHNTGGCRHSVQGLGANIRTIISWDSVPVLCCKNTIISFCTRSHLFLYFVSNSGLPPKAHNTPRS